MSGFRFWGKARKQADPVGFDWKGFQQLVAAIEPAARIAKGGKLDAPAAKFEPADDA